MKTLYLTDGAQLIAEYDDTQALVNRYIPGARLDEILIKIAGATTTFFHMDRLGSTIAQTDDSGVVLEKYKYSAFGETPSLTGTIFGFTGQRFDSEIGQYNYKARYYAPGIGRFLQPDPLGYVAGDMNLYAYVRNDATNLVDPLGNLSVLAPLTQLPYVDPRAPYDFTDDTFLPTDPNGNPLIRQRHPEFEKNLPQIDNYRTTPPEPVDDGGKTPADVLKTIPPKEQPPGDPTLPPDVLKRLLEKNKEMEKKIRNQKCE